MPEGETRLEISQATLDGWVMQIGELLRPTTGRWLKSYCLIYWWLSQVPLQHEKMLLSPVA